MKKKSRILAVDDEEAIAESIAYLLEAPHRTIAVAKDGKEALALAAREKFDLIITDHRMPRAGGLELVRQLRQRKHVGKIVLISAYLSPDHIRSDDEEAIAESIAYLLEAPHRTIAVAKDGKEALALAAREKFDLIITDHRMPRAGGLELVRQLRQRKHVGKIVLISAYLSPDHI